MLWAGSVEMIRTLSRPLESWTARLQLHKGRRKTRSEEQGASPGSGVHSRRARSGHRDLDQRNLKNKYGSMP